MKLRIFFKTPDAVRDAIEDNLTDCLPEGMDPDSDEAWELRSKTKESLEALTGKYIRYGECVTLEFDTETETVTVVAKRG